MTQMYFVSYSFIVVYIPWHFRACNLDSARLYTRKQDVSIEDLKLQLLLNWKYFFCMHHSAAESASQVPFISCKNRFTFLSVSEINFYYLKTWTIFVSCKCDKLWHYKAVHSYLKNNWAIRIAVEPHLIKAYIAHLEDLRDGPLENLWGGEGNFRAAGIFFVIKFLEWIFFRP